MFILFVDAIYYTFYIYPGFNIVITQLVYIFVFTETPLNFTFLLNDELYTPYTCC